MVGQKNSGLGQSRRAGRIGGTAPEQALNLAAEFHDFHQRGGIEPLHFVDPGAAGVEKIMRLLDARARGAEVVVDVEVHL